MLKVITWLKQRSCHREVWGSDVEKCCMCTCLQQVRSIISCQGTALFPSSRRVETSSESFYPLQQFGTVWSCSVRQQMCDRFFYLFSQRRLFFFLSLFMFEMVIQHSAWANRNLIYHRASGRRPASRFKFMWCKDQSLCQGFSVDAQGEERCVTALHVIAPNPCPNQPFIQQDQSNCLPPLLCSFSLLATGLFHPGGGGGGSHDYAAGLAKLAPPLLVLTQLLQVTSRWPA